MSNSVWDISGGSGASQQDAQKINLDEVLRMFEEAEPLSKFSVGALPSGEYLARIASGSMGESRKGTDRYEIQWKLIGGTFDGEAAVSYYYLTEAAMPRSKQELDGLGITGAHLRGVPAPATVAELFIIQKVTESNSYVNEVKRATRAAQVPEEQEAIHSLPESQETHDGPSERLQSETEEATRENDDADCFDDEFGKDLF